MLSRCIIDYCVIVYTSMYLARILIIIVILYYVGYCIRQVYHYCAI